jgi:hypothetical protein
MIASTGEIRTTEYVARSMARHVAALFASPVRAATLGSPTIPIEATREGIKLGAEAAAL